MTGSPLPLASGPPALLIAGPTAVGKTEIAIEVADRLGGEIISVDSMLVYRGMDIGTAKPTAEQRRRVPHHLIDVVEVSEPFDAAQFARLATVAWREVRARGNVPIFCGGSGLYFRALLDGLGNTPATDPTLREELEKTALPELLDELRQQDPETFQRIDRNNARRVIRAIEVIRLSGGPFSSQRASWHKDTPFPAFVLARPRVHLIERINARVDRMFQFGLVEETRHLLERGLANNKTALQALGYRQLAEHLAGARPLEETIDLVKLKTRQFAKRQMTWFRNQMAAEWVEVQQGSEPALVRQIITRYRKDNAFPAANL